MFYPIKFKSLNDKRLLLHSGAVMVKSVKGTIYSVKMVAASKAVLGERCDTRICS